MKNRDSFFELYLSEGFKSVQEKQKQLKEQADPSAVAPSPPAPPVDPAAPAPDPMAATPPATPPAEGAPQPVTVDTVIDKLNVIRGGRSFSDPEFYGQLNTMFNSLGEEDKATLDKLLGQIQQIAASLPPQKKQPEQPEVTPPSPEPAATTPPMAPTEPAVAPSLPAPGPTPPIKPTG